MPIPPDFDWPAQRVIVTGAHGFLGRHLCAHLEALGCGAIYPVRSTEYDLRQQANVKRLFAGFPDATVVVHLAATVGGIGANRKHPGTFFYDNLMMGVMLMEYARRAGVPKFVGIGTICSYPKYTPVPFREEALWDGYPEETNAPYGLAKKMLLVQGQAYRQEFGYNAIHLLVQADNDKAKGFVGLLVIDCLGNPVPGATVTVTGATAIHYSGANGLPSAAATVTATDGQAYAFGVTPGTVTVDATVGGMSLREHVITVRTAVVTTTVIAP